MPNHYNSPVKGLEMVQQAKNDLRKSLKQGVKKLRKHGTETIKALGETSVAGAKSLEDICGRGIEQLGRNAQALGTALREKATAPKKTSR